MSNEKKTNLPFKTYKGCYGIQIRRKGGGSGGWLAPQIRLRGCANDTEAIAEYERIKAAKENKEWKYSEQRIVYEQGGMKGYRIVADYSTT